MMNEEYFIRPDERVDEFSGLRVIQKIGGPHFSLDAILLAGFATVKKGDLVADLGTGGGIVSLLLAADTEAGRIIGIEIQSELADMARRNIALNKVTDRVEILEADLRTVINTCPAGKFDLIVSNPPYRALGAGRINPNPLEAIARHEIECTLEDVLKTGFYLLKNRGRIAFVYRPDRLVDLIVGCRQHRLEPKRLQLVYPGVHRGANLILLEAVKNCQHGLKILNPLIVYNHEIPAG